MPKQTFFNLPEEKRARILEAAIAELGSRPFEKASVANIVEKAGIPRGSFYQYFDDLKDLYRYVLQIIGERKMHYLSHVMGQMEGWDVFRVIKELYAAGLRFAAENPELAGVGNYFFRESKSMKKQLFPDLDDRGWEFFGALLVKGQEQGEVDPDIDVGMAARILMHLTNDITEYFFERIGTEEALLTRQEDYLEMAGKMLHIIELGLRKRD